MSSFKESPRKWGVKIPYVRKFWPPYTLNSWSAHLDSGHVLRARPPPRYLQSIENTSWSREWLLGGWIAHCCTPWVRSLVQVGVLRASVWDAHWPRDFLSLKYHGAEHLREGTNATRSREDTLQRRLHASLGRDAMAANSVVNTKP